MIPSSNYSIKSFCGGYDKNFCYLITCSHSGAQVLIDASIDIKKIKSNISDKLIAVLITHSHADHIQYLNQYLNFYPKLTILGHEYSSKIYKQNFRSLKNNSNVKIGELIFKSIYTPGHYFDSICYQLDPILFTGDTLFVGRTGRIKSENSHIEDLYNSIYRKILTLPDHLRIYPGHDYGKKITIQIKENKKISPLLRAKNLEDFIKKMKDYELKRIPNT